jgi:hypothetical protein
MFALTEGVGLKVNVVFYIYIYIHEVFPRLIVHIPRSISCKIAL